ncbi:hypothetical protein FE784_06780 [Paenibacillus hemerocallicola]|uniref:Right-handed parallel beta-helix repeat-containing protein n=1 Tax=Paenibacillus hemerocallicola TaxID=1172614 RepID=A0A5C4TDY1_9BACL|nr:hypothetical protein [Paenibacillus hemerocallicola]TNJ67241.1 hypothetical protein FE784_06780 [Paenibacillus hemerocallicola]
MADRDSQPIMSRRKMLTALGMAGAFMSLGASGASGSSVMQAVYGDGEGGCPPCGGYAESVEELRTIAPECEGRLIYLEGYYADSPGIGGGILVSVQGASADDGGSVFQSAKPGLFWKRGSDRLVLEDFGVVRGDDASYAAHNAERIAAAFQTTEYAISATPQMTYVYDGDVTIATAHLLDCRKAVFKGITGCIRIASAGCVVHSPVLDDSLRSDDKRAMLVEADHVQIRYAEFRGNGHQECCLEITGSNVSVSDSRLRDASYMILATTGRGTHITGNYFTGGNTKAVLSANRMAATTIPWGDAIKLSSDTNDLGNPNAPGRHDNIITNNIFEDVYRDCVDLFTDGSRTIFSHNVVRNHHWNILDIKCIYRDVPANGTSVDPSRREEAVIAYGNIIKDVDNPYSNGESLFSVVHYKNPESGGKVSDYTLGPNKVSIYGNVIDGVFGYVFRALDSFDVSYYDNAHYNLINNAVYITGESGTRHIDVDRNKFVYANGKDYWGNPLQVVRRTSANCTGGSVSHNRFVCYKKDGFRGAVAAVVMGSRMTANGNTGEGFDIVIDAARGTHLACDGTQAHDCKIAVRVGQYGSTTGVRVSRTYAVSCIQVVAVHTANTAKLIMVDNDGVDITGTAFTDVSSLASTIVKNNNTL